MQAIESSMEKRILKQLHQDDKMDVDTDRRVSRLEAQVDRLSTHQLPAQRIAAAPSHSAANQPNRCEGGQPSSIRSSALGLEA